MKRTTEVHAPDGERYAVSVRRWNPAGANPIAWLALLVRWAWKFGRWSVEVNRQVPLDEYRHTLLPYAFHWHGPPMREDAASDEFDRVVAAIEAGAWPDPAYQAR